MLNPSIFKAYDIRGVYPDELDEDAAFRVGQAMVRFTGAKTVVVGRDARPSSPSLSDAFTRGVLSQGANVIDIGLVSTPMFYFAVGERDPRDAGAMITASHNPAKYNGIKLVRGDALPIGAATGIYDLRDVALAGPYPDQSAGRVVETSIKEAYLDRLFRDVEPGKIRPLKVVVDGGNGMAGAVIRDVFGRLPQCAVEYLYIEPDGSFPNHESNPLKEETLADLRRRVVDSGADFGVAFDGDADRVGFVDERGEPVRGDVMHALLAARLLRKEPGALVVHTVNESRVVEEEVRRAGGRSLMAPVGHGLVKPIMKREGALFGGEISMHYYFRDFYGSECTDFVMLLIMEAMSEDGPSSAEATVGTPLSEIVRPLQRHFYSGEINSEVADRDAALAAIKEKYAALPGAEVGEIDGLRVSFRDATRPAGEWWFSVRPSNTEPLLRLTVEADTREVMETKRDELLRIIRG
jgi:phosphomannomutase